MSQFSIFNARGGPTIERADEELVTRFNTAAEFVETATTEEGRFFLEENVSVVKKEELQNGLVVFCAVNEPGLGASSNADFYGRNGLLLYSIKLPSSLAGESVALEFLGTSHEGLGAPSWAVKSVMLPAPKIFLSVAQGSRLDQIVMSLESDEQIKKKTKGENNVSNSKSSGDDTRTVMDKDGVVHPSDNKKRDADRILAWTPLMRVASEVHRIVYMGNDGVPEYKEVEILQRLEVERSIAINRSDDDPLKSFAAIDNISHLQVVKDEAKTMRLLRLDFQRTKPYELSLHDFYDGSRSEVYPPSTSALCDWTAMERLSRMFLGLERTLSVYCQPHYKGVFNDIRERLT